MSNVLNDLELYKVHSDNRFAQFQASMDSRLSQIDMRFKEMELNLTVRLGLVAASVTKVSVAALSWVIKS